MKLVVATFNRDKQRELEELLGLAGVSLSSLRDVPGATAPKEDGATLLDNARIKARAAAKLTGWGAIADDTGLEVDALDGRPGVHAARYAGPDASYADNVARLLRELADAPLERRTARFRTVCVARLAGGEELETEGVLEGRITLAPRGDQGFGYDPVFEIPELGRTLAELGAAEKNRLSHRARAVHALARLLATRVG